MIKFLYLLIISLSFNLYAEVERLEDKHADEDIYGSMCPEKKYGHTAVIIDTTGPMTDAQFTYMMDLVFDQSIIESIAPYDRISLLNMTGIDVQASETDYIFSKCRPRNGNKKSIHKLDRPTFFGAPASVLKKNTSMFSKRLGDSLDSLRYEDIDGTKAEKRMGEYTQLLEQLKEISRLPKYNFDDSYDQRDLIIVSDLVQYSKRLNLYSSCRKNKKCITWDEFKNKSGNNLWIRGIMPKFGKNNPKVKIIYLNSKIDPMLEIGLLEFWDSYFSEMGIAFDYEFETSEFK